jgi:lysozyme
MNRDKLAAQLRTDEGEVLHAYQDSEGYWTIGIGRLIDKRLGGGITKEESAYLLNNDIIRTEADLDLFIPWWRSMDEQRQLVIANMAFNLGIKKLMEFKNTLKAMSEGRYADAADGMRKSLWAKQVGKRAERLIHIMENG